MVLRTGAHNDVHRVTRLHLRAGSWMLLDDVTRGDPVVRDLYLATEFQICGLEDLLYLTEGQVVDAGDLYVRGSLANRNRDDRAYLGGLVGAASGILPDHEVLVLSGASHSLNLDLETSFFEDSLGLLARFLPNVGHFRDPDTNDINRDLRALFGHLPGVWILCHDRADGLCALNTTALDDLEPTAGQFSCLFDGVGPGEARNHGFRSRPRGESVCSAAEQREKEYQRWWNPVPPLPAFVALARREQRGRPARLPSSDAQCGRLPALHPLEI